ncbi:TetR/AcrR family transcriptional regulator [Nonomuraea endophytica]|uniref:AcrR family transcriptional regulator n=1 Tax=Nonomuraea endophytica TaxID=714136 RepID=A0A7W8A4N9_9ACTN|nr:TetR/AcrR family transcriptional regulator [Nonomuraea endophytica]MBB5079470.1 AcrR family transcriptional regulator [Nonomuraea endophytica]
MPASQWSPSAERILRTAARLFAVHGYSATSTRDIAAAVGVQQPAIYKHFAAKDDILAALVKLGLERPLAVAASLEVVAAPAAVKLHRWLRESLQHLLDSPYVLASILTTPELERDRFAAERALIEQLERQVTDMITQGLREGDVRPINPVTGARLVLVLFDAMALPEFAVSPPEIIDFAFTALLNDPSHLPELQHQADSLPLP